MINHVVNQRYEALEKVGESALFTVYKVRDKVLNRIVALKTVQAPYASDRNFLEALQAGLMASDKLSHPNITGFYEWGMEEGMPYCVVEFVRGINLKERIRRIAPFTLSVAIDFACAIGEALHYAHSVGQPHGDLRPQNIIVSPEGAVKITDFGVQRAIARSTPAQIETLKQAASYHAPELSIKQPGSVGGDIYALGALLYEMLTGTPVYSAETPDEIAELHAFSKIPSPRVINPGVPRSVEGIVIKCLQKRPDQRYRTAADLLNDLKLVRDALRFGKPLSWSPIDLDNLPPVPAPPVVAVAIAEPVSVIPVAAPVAAPITTRVVEPVAEVAASSLPAAMPANNQLRAADERVSIYLKVAIGTVTVIILACLIGFVGIWSAMWVVPKPSPVPQMVGKPVEEVRNMAKTLGVHLIEHGEYNDKPRNIVYKTDHDRGTQIHAGQTINIWYSQGAAYVQVPNVTNLIREEAEKRLRDAGLVAGKMTPEFSATVPAGQIIRQNVSYKKRVFHGTVVDLVYSDGPKPEFATGDTGNENAPNNGNGTGNGSAPNISPNTGDTGSGNVSPDGATPDEESHTFNRTINIPNDGLGIRQVRIEYKDSRGWQPAVIDELHNPGDKIPDVTFDYYGKNITMRIYYDGRLQWERTFDPQNKTQIR